ncbi:DUF6965 family protein [Dyadobacter sp. CY312]|uniref:DUF6965 family protein n=1 Tax=Dyadobacter sp. CY312 TaxID=2907303 RepID=UPI001F319844|nr:hypothetical protein [Dyadobacter sp. CY312]MCE7039205.1 hypothetical protein [Dyadobacter sp. CY312]
MSIQEHEQELADLAIYFQTAKFPAVPFKLNKYIVVHDPALLISGDISRIQMFKGNDTVRDSLFKHLRELKAICEETTSHE